MKHILFTALIGAGLMVSCFEDKGNYDYSEFTEPEISNVEDSYSKISFQDTLFIHPEITPEAEYDYLWTIYESYSSLPDNGMPQDTIGREKDLAYPVSLPNGTYDICLRATNRETGYTVLKKISLISQTEFSLGFYVLKETPDGNTDVDLHTPDALMEDLIARGNGVAMPGKPRSMCLFWSYCYIDEETGSYVYPRALSVCSENDVRLFSLNDMTTIFTHDNMFYGAAPANDVPLYYYPSCFVIVYMSEGGITYNSQMPRYVYGPMYSAGKLGAVYSIDKGYKPNINMLVSQYAFGSYFFDDLNHRFLFLDGNGIELSTFDDNDADGHKGEYSPNNVPADYQLQFFGYNYVGDAEYSDLGYALFEDAQGQKHLYVLDVSGSYSNPIIRVDDIPTDKHITDATLFASNEYGASRIYFDYGGQVWAYNATTGEEKQLTLQGFEGGEITYISNRYWTYEDDEENNFNYLVVGAYKDGEYQLYMYDMTGGEPTPGKDPARILKGEGKAVKVHFNSPKMDVDNYEIADYYPYSY